MRDESASECANPPDRGRMFDLWAPHRRGLLNFGRRVPNVRTMVQSRTDSSGAFVIALAAGPMVLPVLGVHVGDLLFALPLITCVWGAIAAFSAARRRPERRLAWLWFSAACTVAALASILGIVGKVSGEGETAGLYVGLVASGCIVMAASTMAGQALRAKGWAAMVDPLLLACVGASLGIYLLVLPGFERGDAIL